MINVFDDLSNKEYVLIKPHHFLDYLYDLGIDNRHMGEDNPNGNKNAELCRMFIDGKIDRIRFTPFVDDVCRPCKKLADGVRCVDYFDDETTLYYGYRYKNDFNYQLDLKLNEVLPDVFDFDEIRDTYEVLCILHRSLTEQIIKLYKWDRTERAKYTFMGIEKGIIKYRK